VPDTRTHADALRVYAAGATRTRGHVGSMAESIGGYRSATEIRSLEVRRVAPIRGIHVLYAAGKNGPGQGLLSAPDANTLTWTPPGAAIGEAVTIADGETKIIEGEEPSRYIRVKRVSDTDLAGQETCDLAAVVNNLIGFPDVQSAAAVAGMVDFATCFIVNRGTVEMTNIKIWLGDCDVPVRIGWETPVAGAVPTPADRFTAPAGITWSAGTTSGTGLSIASLAPGAEMAVRVERTITADSAAGAYFQIELRRQFDVDGETYNGSDIGKFAIVRDDAEAWGIWLGQDEEPDGDAAPDEIFTTSPHDTTLTVEPGHTYRYFVRKRNRYGLWELTTESKQFRVNEDGTAGHTRPTAPEEVRAVAVADGRIRVRGFYQPMKDAAAESTAQQMQDGDLDTAARAHLWVIYISEDAAPDPDVDVPAVYQPMSENLEAIESLDVTTDADYLEGAPVQVLARVRRVIETEDRVDTEGGALPETGAGTIVTVEGDFSGWASTGMAKVLVAGGALREYVTWSARTSHSLTIDAAGRAQWGSEASEGDASDTIVPVDYVDSENTEPVDVTADALGPARPSGCVFLGPVAVKAVAQPAPDGTPIPIPTASEGWTWEMRAGDTQLLKDGIVKLRVLYSSDDIARSKAYFASGGKFSAAAITGAAGSDEPAVAVASPVDTLYLAVRRQFRLLFQGEDNIVRCNGILQGRPMPDIHPAAPAFSRWNDTTLQVWDPATEQYVVWGRLTWDGHLETSISTSFTKSSAEIAAL